MNRDLRLLQVAEQLVEVPTILYFLKQPIAEQIMDIPVPRGRGGSGDGGLQGFHPGQGSQRTAEQLVDIPVPGAGLHDSLPGPELAASSAVSRDELGQCFFFFALFPEVKKCGVRREFECEGARGSTLSSHQVACTERVDANDVVWVRIDTAQLAPTAARTFGWSFWCDTNLNRGVLAVLMAQTAAWIT